ncbi:hypothetical protein [Metabacillus endolithicus]|uniref:DUF892 family protein n=2 Tax=Metabacillus endolithicus TaxID=1535204 RepID=A0ABW5C4D8_9BACI|nr:hypothetical protein [Metabacillus endolithicus]UPG64954.1 hypothetical protein MVE64_08095 [Metabacillus endolithicus]
MPMVIQVRYGKLQKKNKKGKKMKTENPVLLIELDDEIRNQQLNEVEKWFEHVLTAQMAFEVVIQKTTPKIQEPHIKEAIVKIEGATKEHQKIAKQLFQLINRNPDIVMDRILGTTVSKLEEGLLTFQDFMGGAVGSWQGMHQLLLLNQQAMGAFAVAEQLGLSLGIKEIVKATFKVVHEKTMHQLLIQEYMLEMAPISILYKQNV